WQRDDDCRVHDQQGGGAPPHPRAGGGVGEARDQRERPLPRVLSLEDVARPAGGDRRRRDRAHAAGPPGRRRGSEGDRRVLRLGGLTPRHRTAHRDRRRGVALAHLWMSTISPAPNWLPAVGTAMYALPVIAGDPSGGAARVWVSEVEVTVGALQ